jgi:hypothetical protein
MPGSAVQIDCPLCGSRMRVPRAGRRLRLTCNNGHTLVHTFEPAARRLPAVPFIALVGVLLALSVLAFTHPWTGLRPGPTPVAIAGGRAPGH